MTPQITTLFLDIGGVLLSNGWDRTARRKAADAFDLQYEEMDERHHLIFDVYERGAMSLDEYLAHTVFHEKRPFTVEQFRAFMFRQSRPHPEMIELMLAIKHYHGLRVAALSNEGRDLTIHRIETFGLRRIIDVFISSCFVHCRKPDQAIYRVALDVTQAAPAQVLYIDDRSLFVDVAHDLGIGALCHRSFRATLAALAKLGLEPPPGNVPALHAATATNGVSDVKPADQDRQTARHHERGGDRSL